MVSHFAVPVRQRRGCAVVCRASTSTAQLRSGLPCQCDNGGAVCGGGWRRDKMSHGFLSQIEFCCYFLRLFFEKEKILQGKQNQFESNQGC